MTALSHVLELLSSLMLARTVFPSRWNLPYRHQLHSARQILISKRFSAFKVMASSEQEAARQAAAHKPADDAPTIFDKIVAKQIPAEVIYEDDLVLAFRDINKQAPVHFLVIPKQRNGLTGLSKATEQHEVVLGRLMRVIATVAQQEGLEKGYRVVINDGPDGCQSVYHLHAHVMGGRQMGWPPG